MPRRRLLSVEFFDDADLGALGAAAGRLYQCIWVHADDNGVAPRSPATFRVRAFGHGDPPPTLADVQRWWGLLEQGGFLVRFEAGGAEYVAVKPRAWDRWQLPIPRPSLRYPVTDEIVLDRVLVGDVLRCKSSESLSRPYASSNGAQGTHTPTGERERERAWEGDPDPEGSKSSATTRVVQGSSGWYKPESARRSRPLKSRLNPAAQAVWDTLCVLRSKAGLQDDLPLTAGAEQDILAALKLYGAERIREGLRAALDHADDRFRDGRSWREHFRTKVLLSADNLALLLAWADEQAASKRRNGRQAAPKWGPEHRMVSAGGAAQPCRCAIGSDHDEAALLALQRSATG